MDSDGDGAGDTYDPAPSDPSIGGPIFWLRFDQDLIGYRGEVPTLDDGVQLAEGIYGQAGEFEGIDDLQYDAPGNIVTSVGTFSTWVRTGWSAADEPTTHGLLSLGDLGTTYFNVTWGWNGRTQLAVNCFNTPGYPNEWASGEGVDASWWDAERWYQIVVTWQDGAFIYYVDGERAGDEAFTSIPTGHRFISPGADHLQSTESIDGDLDELKIFDYVLSDAQVKYLYLEVAGG